jgi:biotin transporter BioY
MRGYIDPHHFWTHFMCGFIFGGGLGAWVAHAFSDSGLILLIAAAVTGAAFALSCGWWGDRTWRRISEWVITLWTTLWGSRL